MNEGIFCAIGNTPLVKLNNIQINSTANLYVKLENMNPSGSAKDRSAMSIMRKAIEEGLICEDSTIIESSSGNFGIAVAQICRNLGLRFVCVCDEKTTEQNIKILRAYGADVEIVKEKDKKTGEYLTVRKERVKELLNKVPNSFWPNQYGNIYNSIGHQQTMEEIIHQLDKIDYLFVAVSTFGTIRGYANVINNYKLSTKLIAVDAEGSMLFDVLPKKRLIPGHGAACVPDLFDKELVDDYILVSDKECINGCRYLLQKEGIFAGGSTGGIISAIKKYESKIEKNANCVFIAHDRGDRYLDTIYSEQWVKTNIEIV